MPVTTLYTGTTLATCSQKIIMIEIKFFLLLTIICLNFFQLIKLFFLLRVKNILIPNFFTHLPKREISHELVIDFKINFPPASVIIILFIIKCSITASLFKAGSLLNFHYFQPKVVCSFCNKTINANNN